MSLLKQENSSSNFHINQDKSLPIPVFFSLLTPSWNRSKGLQRLYQSLCIQDFNDFEWIVGDDGSTDGTLDFLTAISRSSPFPIRIISSDKRIGKASMDNLLLKRISGEFFICCDSDDWLLPNALSILSSQILQWRKSGYTLDFVVASNLTPSGTPTSTISVPFKTLLTCADVISAVSGDASLALRSECFSRCRHEEVDFVVTESFFYSKVAQTTFGVAVDCFVKVMDRSFSNSISFSPGIKYCRGSAYSLRNYICNSTVISSLQIITIVRYSLNGDLPHKFYLPLVMRRSISVLSRIRLFMFLIPAGILFSLRDHFFGGLVKTHIQFETNRHNALITYL